MRKLIALLLFTTTVSFGQTISDKLLGNWINTKTEMKDGSKLITYHKNYESHMELTFYSNYYIYSIYPSQLFGLLKYPFKLNGKNISVSEAFSYEIEKVSSDSLELVEKMPGMSEDKLKRYFYVKKKILSEKVKSKFKGKKVLNASPYFTPKFNGSISHYVDEALNKRHENLILNGIISINLDNKSVSLKSLEYSNNKSKLINKVIKKLEGSYSKWLLGEFKRYERIEIEFVLSIKKTNTYRGCKIKLFTQSIDKLKSDYGKPMEIMNKSSEFFNKGLRFIERKDYKNAIKSFSKSYKIDHSYLDALYNRATSYYLNNQIDMACKDWEKLKLLGQKGGEVRYSEYCKKTENSRN